MKGYLNWPILTVVCLIMFLIGGIDQKTKNALKVQHILKKIEKHTSRPKQKDLAAAVTQTEVNDYIAFRLAREKKAIIQSFTLALQEKNHVSGTTRLDPEALGLGMIFGEVLEFDFKGMMHTGKGLVRMDWTVLKLNGQSVKPEVLDMLIQVASRYNGAESVSIRDWFEMPKGIKRVNTKKEGATLYY